MMPEERIEKIQTLIEDGQAGKANWIYKIEKLKALRAIKAQLEELNDYLVLDGPGQS